MVVVDFNKKHSLGQRAFIIFLFRRIKYALLLFIIWGAVAYSERWIVLRVSPEFFFWFDYCTHLFLLLAVGFFALMFFETYMEYRYYTYLFTDDAFIMTYGYIVRNEVATLYHHIQNVNIERNVLDRAIGVSKLVIMMTGSDRDTRRNQIVLPAVGKRKAKLVQAELLKRARRHAAAALEEE